MSAVAEMAWRREVKKPSRHAERKAIISRRCSRENRLQLIDFGGGECGVNAGS